MFNYITTWLDRNKVKTIYLIRKDKLTTGFVSDLYIDGKNSGYALDTFGLETKRLRLRRSDIVTDEFDQPHIDNLLVLDPLSGVGDRLASVVDVDVDSNHMALEC